MSALLEKIRAAKAAKSTELQRQPHHHIAVEDINLRGTGLTKREAEKNTRAYIREADKSIKAEKSLFVSAAEKEFTDSVEDTIERMRVANERENIKYDDSQLRAIGGMLHNKCCVLIGAAGTGKTTVTKKFVGEIAKLVSKIDTNGITFIYAIDPNDARQKPQRMLRSEAIKKDWKIEKDEKAPKAEMPAIAFASYTGRATQQLKRALPKEWHQNTSTIHSLLGYAPVFEEVEDFDKITKMPFIKTVRRFRPSFDKNLKLPYDVIVLDEASMIPIPLFNELIDALHETARIILIGDIHQLPPVYGKSVLGYAMRKWPVFELTTIHRQAAGNAIISNAHNVLKGKPIENASNFRLIGNGHEKPSPGGSGQLQKYMLQVIQQLADLKLYDPYRDAIIVPYGKSESKNGSFNPVASQSLNSHLVTMFNSEIKENGIIINKRLDIHTGTGHAYFAIRDKVMITSNINTVEPPITNGMIGIVESINFNGRYDMKRSQIEVVDDSDFDENEESEIDLDLDNLDFALSAQEDEKEKKEDDETQDQRQSSHVLTIKFENGQSYSCSTAGDYRRITHGYAATCHKSQGGEYPNIIILCHSVNARMLSQEWLYTAITRARENVYIICNDRGLNQALSRQVIKGNTLKDKIKSYVIKTKSDDEIGLDITRYPILWDNKEI
jgi:ATP-dependent exoDNAse (exonuclease V) alpha subunit